MLQLWDEFRLGCNNNYIIIACYAVFSGFRLENAYRTQRRILNPTVTQSNMCTKYAMFQLVGTFAQAIW